MIAAEWLQNAFLQQGNYTDSKYLQELSAIQIDFYLNKAKNLLLEHWAGLAENNDSAKQHLRQVTERGVNLTTQLVGDKFIGTYPNDFFKPLKAVLFAKLGNCPERRLEVRRLPSDKIENALKDPNIQRFWDFEQTFGEESSKGFEVYVTGLTPTRLVLDYIRKIPDVACPQCEKAEQYVPFQGGQPISQDLEIDSVFFAEKMVSLAVFFAQKDHGDQKSQVDLQSIINVEKVF